MPQHRPVFSKTNMAVLTRGDHISSNSVTETVVRPKHDTRAKTTVRPVRPVGTAGHGDLLPPLSASHADSRKETQVPGSSFQEFGSDLHPLDSGLGLSRYQVGHHSRLRLRGSASLPDWQRAWQKKLTFQFCGLRRNTQVLWLLGSGLRAPENTYGLGMGDIFQESTTSANKQWITFSRCAPIQAFFQDNTDRQSLGS
ncbi:hypothetical protein B0T21DRAFT_349431 [Apiosordaria backusii]|uniref:Uncharacterized protein n=1 Tax=Apiosordaria backusii TaxID=314023 RepID=A0AA40BDV0_9PEZI|nr:hypothetical protein B0T21DRAFT_349431 [Apiosordaria backusii]